jgi:hypothetical protein
MPLNYVKFNYDTFNMTNFTQTHNQRPYVLCVLHITNVTNGLNSRSILNRILFTLLGLRYINSVCLLGGVQLEAGGY